MPDLLLTGSDLTINQLSAFAAAGGRVALTQDAHVRIRAARNIVEQALAGNLPVYGLNTGLGAQAGNRLSNEAQTDFSWQTLRGRAHAIGEPMSREAIRAVMLVRANTLCKGAAGISPAVANYLVDCLNADLTPKVGETGSIGAGDLVMNATLALALFGEGDMLDAHGQTRAAEKCLHDEGLIPPELAPRDGLALANHSSVSAGLAALSVSAAWRTFAAVQTAAALSMHGFQANVSPLNPDVLALRPQPGQQSAAAGLLRRLAGSPLSQGEGARRLQDPLSIRNLAQIHGAFIAAVQFAQSACEAEINGASDNPLVLLSANQVVSGGAYHTPHLTNALETVTRACVHVAVTQLARLARMLSPRFTDLPLFLAQPGEHSNGFAPLMKTAEAVLGELIQAAAPVPLWPSINADGVEDSLTQAPLAAKSLNKVLDKLAQLTAIELMVAAQAVDLRGATLDAPVLIEAHRQIRKRALELSVDRPLAKEVTALHQAIVQGVFAEPD